VEDPLLEVAAEVPAVVGIVHHQAAVGAHVHPVVAVVADRVHPVAAVEGVPDQEAEEDKLSGI
jgi:isochorismate synthase EntC